MKVEIIKGSDGLPVVRVTDPYGVAQNQSCEDMHQARTYASGFQDGYNTAMNVLGHLQRWCSTSDTIAMDNAEADARAAAKGNPNPPFVVGGHEFDDEDSNLAGDGNYPPFYIFDTARQQNLPGSYSRRDTAQLAADKLNEASMAGVIPRPIVLALFERIDTAKAMVSNGEFHGGALTDIAGEFLQALGSLRTDYTQEELVDDYLESI